MRCTKFSANELARVMADGIEVSRGLLFGEKHESLQSCSVYAGSCILTGKCSLQFEYPVTYMDGTMARWLLTSRLWRSVASSVQHVALSLLCEEQAKVYILYYPYNSTKLTYVMYLYYLSQMYSLRRMIPFRSHYIKCTFCAEWFLFGHIISHVVHTSHRVGMIWIIAE